MEKKIEIKGITINDGRPKICVPVMGDTIEAIVGEAEAAVAEKIPMLEWRADYFLRLEERKAFTDVLQALSLLCGETILLVTVRTKAQGGKAELSRKRMEEVMDGIAASRCADLVDVEYFQWEDAPRIIENLQRQGVKVVASQHDFAGTPSSENMDQALRRMREGGADIVKLAVMPQDLSDTLRLMDVTHRFRRTCPDTPIITMAMGAEGMLSRISGEYFGSCVTFGCRGKASAPGQLPAQQLRRILEELHAGREVAL